MSGLVGFTRTRAICCVSARPRNVQVLPPSVVFQTPSPCDTLPRIGNSPVPTYTMSGFDSETPIAPMVPPPVVPNQYSLDRAAEPATATLRPPRKMPISRQVRPAKTVESYAWAGAERGVTSSRMTAAKDSERMDTGVGLLRVESRGHHVSTERPNPARALTAWSSFRPCPAVSP